MIGKDGKQKGFIALMAVFFLSASLLALVVSLSAAGFYSRFNIFDCENKKISYFLASSCMNFALLDLAKNEASFPKNFLVGDSICQICNIDAADPMAIKIQTRAAYLGAYTNLDVSAKKTGNNIKITSFAESPSYIGPACNAP